MANTARLSNVPGWLYALLGAALLAQFLFWSRAREVSIPWAGVGPAPSAAAIRVIGFGDNQLVYRAGGLMLQQFGDSGETVTPLAQYDYGRLVRWLDLLVQLDAESNYIPTLAGYYFGHSRVPHQARRIALFLRDVAIAHPQRHWRWLVHAVYLARHHAKDMPLALELAGDLSALPVSDLPVWARQLEAFALADVGDTEAARDILELLLATTPDLPRAERTFMERYIADRLDPVGSKSR